MAEAAMQMETPVAQARDGRWWIRQLLPYCVAISLIVMGAGAATVVGGGEFAIAGAALFGAAVGYPLGRLIAWRGKLSLRTTAVVLPLLVAIACSILPKVTPFWARQRTADALRSAQIQTYARPPQVAGEWALDSEGYVLPAIALDWIGADSMSIVRGVDGLADDLVRLDLKSLALPSQLSSLNIRCDRADSITPELVEWINEFESIDSLTIVHERLCAGDMKLLGQIRHRWGAEFSGGDESTDYSELGRLTHLSVSAIKLSAAQSTQLAQVDTPWLRLSLDELSSSALQPFYKYDSAESQSGIPRSLNFSQRWLGNEELRKLLSLELESLVLGAPTLEVDWESFNQGQQSANVSTKYVSLQYVSSDIEGCVSLVRAVKPKTLSVLFDLSITRKNVLQLAEVESLEEIQYFDDAERVWVTIKRPFSELDSAVDAVEP